MALMDYLGFTFNGTHSSDYNIIRVTNSNRYSESIIPTMTDTVLTPNGFDGRLLVNSQFSTKDFSINFAFDNMSEETRRQLRNWLAVKAEGDLTFDEEPYKTYYVKVTSAPNISWLPFDSNDGKRVYKGEGTIKFLAYIPYAHCSGDKKYKDNYSESAAEGKIYAPTLSQWIDASGLKEKGNYDVPGATVSIYNAGDIPTPFKIVFQSGKAVDLKLGDNELKVAAFITTDSFIQINTETHLIEGVTDATGAATTGKVYNKYIESGGFFKLPTGESTLSCGSACQAISYDYLYY